MLSATYLMAFYMEQSPGPPDEPTDPQMPTLYDRIEYGLINAETVRREIDDATAKYISGIIPAAMDSATRLLHFTGEVQSERLQLEMHHEGSQRGLNEFDLRMINALGTYAAVKGDRPAVEGWEELR